MLLIAAVIWVVPLYVICGRIGWSSGWAILGLIPVVAVALLWAVAFGRWNREA